MMMDAAARTRRFSFKEQLQYALSPINKTLLICALLVLVAVHFIVSISTDVEYSAEVLPEMQHPEMSSTGLFARGLDSVQPHFVEQGRLYDCNFLAPLTSLVRTGSGRQRVIRMFHEEFDGRVAVKPGDNSSPAITVNPLTSEEMRIYGLARGGGSWLPVLEKVYGTYRNERQTMDERVLRLIKHTLTEGRPSPQTRLPGFGASFGKGDDEAFSFLTGHHARKYSTAAIDLGAFGLAKSSLNERQIRGWFDRKTVTQEIIFEQREALVDAFQRGAIVTASTSRSGDISRFRLRSDHAYAVLDFDPIKDIITLQDPYAEIKLKTNHPFVRYANLSLSEFNKIFSAIYIEEAN